MGQICCTHGKTRNVYNVLIIQHEGTRLSEKERLDGSRKNKVNVGEVECEGTSRIYLQMLGSSYGLVVQTLQYSFVFHKRQGHFSESKRLLAFQALCFMGLDNNREIHQEKTAKTESSSHSDSSLLQNLEGFSLCDRATLGSEPKYSSKRSTPTPLPKGHIAICSKSLYYDHVEADQ
jgi:hypothetical protein